MMTILLSDLLARPQPFVGMRLYSVTYTHWWTITKVYPDGSIVRQCDTDGSVIKAWKHSDEIWLDGSWRLPGEPDCPLDPKRRIKWAVDDAFWARWSREKAGWTLHRISHITTGVNGAYRYHLRGGGYRNDLSNVIYVPPVAVTPPDIAEASVVSAKDMASTPKPNGKERAQDLEDKVAGAVLWFDRALDTISQKDTHGITLLKHAREVTRVAMNYFKDMKDGK